MRHVFSTPLNIAVLLGPMLIAHPILETRIPIVTVCEVLADYPHYANTAIAVVGRLQSTVGIIDGYDFLAEDKCDHPVRRNKRTLPNKILVGYYPDKWMPQAPTEKPILYPAAIREKLITVQRTTMLGFHNEYGLSGSRRVANRWAVIYGRIVSPPNPGQKGYRPGSQAFFDAPLVILTKPYNIHTLRADGTVIPASQTETQ